MSVSMFVVNPATDFEKKLHVPVATEEVYKSFWIPKATSLKAYFTLRFGIGIEIGAQEAPRVRNELSQLHAEFQKNPVTEQQVHITQRIERLIDELDKIYKENPQARVFIG